MFDTVIIKLSVEALEPVATLADVLAAQQAARSVYVSPALRAYVVALLGRTREDRRVALGASPRAGLLLVRAAKARALLEGRDVVLPDDVQALAGAVLTHRLVLDLDAHGVSADVVVADALAATGAR